MFRVKAVNPLLLQPLLGEGVVCRESWGARGNVSIGSTGKCEYWEHGGNVSIFRDVWHLDF